MAGNSNFDAIASTTLKNYRKSLEDNIFNAMPLLAWLMSGNRKRVLNGGETIVEPLMYGKNTTVKSYSGYETLDTAAQEGISAAEYNWKQVAGSVTISRKEERQNSGESQLINLLTAKIKQLEMSIRDALSTMLFGDGTGNGSKDYLGLQAIVADTPTTGTVGGIDRSTETWWRNRYGTSAQSATAFDTLLGNMRTRYNDASKGSDHPDFAIADQTVFEGYESLLVSNERFVDTKTGDAGFENLKFKGLVLMFDDVMSGGGRLYMLNSKYLSWVVDKETDFKMTDFVRPENQDAKTAQILLMGNLTASNCENQGVITGIT
jgi:hypothetical protein